MPGAAMPLLVATLVAAAVVLWSAWLLAGGLARVPLLDRYDAWWRKNRGRARIDQRLARLPLWQAIASPLLVAAAGWLAQPLLIVAAIAALGLPPALLRHRARGHRAACGEQLDRVFVVLANALSTTPNLGEALRSQLPHIEPPMREEIAAALAEVELGRTLEAALLGMARRLDVPGLEAAVSALLLGRRTGGDLAQLLKRMARTLREMARLEGVIRTRTAEGRYQAWVMGAMPPLLVVALEQLDPEWLAPLWHDPIGWLLLAVAAVTELVAVALIRRIMAVEV